MRRLLSGVKSVNSGGNSIDIEKMFKGCINIKIGIPAQVR